MEDQEIHVQKAPRDSSEDNPQIKVDGKESNINPEIVFAVTMFKCLTESSSSFDQNVVLCPYSLEIALTSLLPGTSDKLRGDLMRLLCANGRDFEQLIKEVGEAQADETLVISTTGFYDERYPLRQSFIAALSAALEFKWIQAPFASSPAAALNVVNTYVSQKTNGEISHVLNELAPTTTLIILNIVNFTGPWEKQFDTKYTERGIFRGVNGVEQAVQFMKNEHAYIRAYNVGSYKWESSSDDPKIVILDILGRKYSVMLLLPADASSGTALLEKQLTPEKLLIWRRKAKVSYLCMVVPKFRISFDEDLIDCTKLMGLKELYTPSRTAFSNMFDSGDPICVSKLKQQTILELDEFGVKASAVTGLNTEYSSANEPDFVANRPFLLIIWDEMTNIPKFIARITNPNA
ncbi:serpin B8-like [Paramacrobiotus metropolitanus]|uniref:serpin B8-like n=1 Tax=Paramacrobiotus metropolitanus TaxID=2943436 RepID=UPI002445D5DB|nr:serpin B8-like [Paramacrobiotus metropolitanus]